MAATPASAAQAPARVNIVVIGHFARDKIIAAGQETASSGGSVYYGALALRRLGLAVAVVTRLSPDDFASLDALRAEGILVFAQAAEQTSGIENTYLTKDMDRRLCRPLGFAGPIQFSGVPPLQSDIWLVGPIMAGEVDLAFVRQLAQRGPIALDAQGFVRVREGESLVFRDWSEKGEGLSYVHYLKADSAEAEVLTGSADLREAAQKLAGYGPREVVLTHASGVLVYAQGRYHEAPFFARSLAGRTGRGDTCFAAYLASRLSHEPGFACEFAARVTSLKLETPGPFRGFPER
jgi:sugar/nucleoside kinase (ribokinase family)